MRSTRSLYRNSVANGNSKGFFPMKSGRAISLFCGVALLWWVFDRMVKNVMDLHQVGSVIVPNVLGLFEFTLVHNKGAAWGIFSNSTMALGIFSCLVCLFIAIYYFAFRKARAHLLETLGLSLMFAGGLGNAFDRLVQGYVVDFINATFMEFPVFNIADIGVTCGIVLFLIGFATYDSRVRDQERKDG